MPSSSPALSSGCSLRRRLQPTASVASGGTKTTWPQVSGTGCVFADYKSFAVQSGFHVKVEEVSQRVETFLDLDLSKSVRCVACRPSFKPLYGMPLSTVLGHFPTVHQWPTGYAHRLRMLSSTSAIATEALNTLRDRWDAVLYPMAALPRSPPHLRPHKPPAPDDKTRWLVLGYHPAFQHCHIGGRIAEWLSNSEMKLVMDACLPITVRVAWRNSRPSLANSLLRISLLGGSSG